MSIIVAFTGRRRVGKTTCALELIDIAKEFGIEFKRYSFADSLRLEFSKKTGIAVKMLTDDNYKEEFRQKLIDFGAEKRHSNPRVFIDALFDNILPHENLCVDDARFLNEIHALTQKKAYIYQVQTTNKVRESRGWVYNKEVDESPSENEIGDLSRETMYALNGDIIYNNKSIEDLRRELHLIFRNNFIKISV